MKNHSRLGLRMQKIQTFHAMDLFARARAMEEAGKSVIHLEVGEPDFDTPEPVLNAGIEALKNNRTHYTPALGLMELRQAISNYYSSQYSESVSPERIVITPGASGALLLVLGIMISPGDQILMADPGYPANRHFVRMFEGRAKSIPVNADTNFQPSLQQVGKYWNDNCKALMLASPSNPTGTLLDFEELTAISDFVRDRNGYLIVDEIYHGLVYESACDTAANLGEHVFVINSFSKYFGMTGWRLGWIVAPDNYVAEIDKLAQNIFLAASTPAQYAALAAFRTETLKILENRRETFMQRRDFLMPELEKLGFTIGAKPQGAFYIYANSSALSQDSYQLAHDVLSSTQVAMTPGIDFGSNQPAHYMRFAYTTSLDNLHRAVERLSAYFQKQLSLK